MLKRTLVGVSLFLFVLMTTCRAQDQDNLTDLSAQIKALQLENVQLKEKINSIEGVVYDKLSGEGRSYDYMDEGDTLQTGFIRKGGFTGTTDKIMDINLFIAARYQQVKNDRAGTDDIDGFSTPFAHLMLSGQAFTGINYFVNYNFRNDRLLDAAISWSPNLGEIEMVKDFSINVGLQTIFLSPAGIPDGWELDFIEWPLFVTYMLPPDSRDIGAYVKADLLDQGRLKLWAGIWNGTHRAIPLSGTASVGGTQTAYQPVDELDPWGATNGNDNDQVASMARLQVNLLDEENLFFMLSSGVELNRVRYVEWADNGDGAQGAGDSLTNRKNLTDRLYDLASEFRFMQRKAWVKGEFMHAYLADSLADTQRGYYVAAGSRLDVLNEQMAHFEVLARYDRIKLNDSLHTADDKIYKTVGLNYYFDPEHKHDAKIQLNYIFKKDSGPTNISDNTLLLQFVLGF